MDKTACAVPQRLQRCVAQFWNPQKPADQRPPISPFLRIAEALTRLHPGFRAIQMREVPEMEPGTAPLPKGKTEGNLSRGPLPFQEPPKGSRESRSINPGARDVPLFKTHRLGCVFLRTGGFVPFKAYRKCNKPKTAHTHPFSDRTKNRYLPSDVETRITLFVPRLCHPFVKGESKGESVRGNPLVYPDFTAGRDGPGPVPAPNAPWDPCAAGSSPGPAKTGGRWGWIWSTKSGTCFNQCPDLSWPHGLRGHLKLCQL